MTSILAGIVYHKMACHIQSFYIASLHPSRVFQLYTMTIFTLTVIKMKAERIIWLISSYSKCKVDHILRTEWVHEPKNGYFLLNLTT